jgi:hypothetical protein
MNINKQIKILDSVTYICIALIIVISLVGIVGGCTQTKSQESIPVPEVNVSINPSSWELVGKIDDCKLYRKAISRCDEGCKEGPYLYWTICQPNEYSNSASYSTSIAIP